MSNTKVDRILSRIKNLFTTRNTPLPIQHQIGDNGQGRFFVALEGEELAFLDYSNVKNTVMTLNQTDVSDKLRGKGVGKLLIIEAVNYARKQELKIVPMCPYAKSVFDKNPHLKDVLKGW